MADLLYDLLRSPSDSAADQPAQAGQVPPSADPASLEYLTSLASQPISALESTEQQSLLSTSHTLNLQLQALSKKSHKPIISSAAHHTSLHSIIPSLTSHAADLGSALPRLDAEALRFSTTYHKNRSSASTSENENALLASRRRALLLSRSVERLVDVLELPTLLSSSVATAPSTNNYASALDLNAHIRRLHSLYPASPLVKSIASQADDAMRVMASNLIVSLRTPQLKLAASLRTIGWLRRVLPDLEADVTMRGGGSSSSAGQGTSSQDRALGAIFLACRLSTLLSLLEALEPLRELADQERLRQAEQAASIKLGGVSGHGAKAWSGGQQTERFLKRYIEIFREQSFAIVSMHRSIFPATLDNDRNASAKTATTIKPPSSSSSPSPSPLAAAAGLPRRPTSENTTAPTNTTTITTTTTTTTEEDDPLEPLPPALSTFPLHLVEMLLDTLRTYLPTVRDQGSRDSLLTQVLYCAGSLGRLGGDFGLFLATLDVGGDAEAEWVEVVRRHRQLAGRLESVVGGRK